MSLPDDLAAERESTVRRPEKDVPSRDTIRKAHQATTLFPRPTQMSQTQVPVTPVHPWMQKLQATCEDVLGLGSRYYPAVDDYAILLGFKDEHKTIGIEEDVRLGILDDILTLRVVQRQSIIQEKANFANFCATYLVALVDRVLNPPPNANPLFKIDNSWFVMLRHCTQSADYFHKYRNSTKDIANQGGLLCTQIATWFADSCENLEANMLGP